MEAGLTSELPKMESRRDERGFAVLCPGPRSPQVPQLGDFPSRCDLLGPFASHLSPFPGVARLGLQFKYVKIKSLSSDRIVCPSLMLDFRREKEIPRRALTCQINHLGKLGNWANWTN
jgi:hypothetical protein